MTWKNEIDDPKLIQELICTQVDILILKADKFLFRPWDQREEKKAPPIYVML